MSIPQNDIYHLWNRFVSKTATQSELDELFIYLQQSPNDHINLELIQQYLSGDVKEEINKEYWLNKANAIAGEQHENISRGKIRIAHRVHFLKTAWFRYAAAILIILGIGAYLWNKNNSTHSSTLATSTADREKPILPGGQKAILTLADGRTIILDSAANGQIAMQNGTLINKEGDKIIYGDSRHPGAAKPNPGSLNTYAAYNTMSTPRGGQYQLTLPDGTHVFLNASSSITYPTAFTNRSREVTISGEAYFQIKPNHSQPFIVKTKTEQITVLGTEFNINSYDDEPLSKTSLINGSIKINNQVLTPGEAYTNGKIIKTNITHDIAWKNGYFSFTDADIKTVMRQLSRWYDIDVKYSGTIPTDEFNGKIGRDLTLTQVLKILSKARINYRVENKTIIILP
jgi:transmembrane sensor